MAQTTGHNASRPTGVPARVAEYIAALRLDDSAQRVYARKALVVMGPQAVPALTEALFAPESSVRWEAATALLEMADPSSAAALVQALDDEEVGIRWLASEALIKLGANAVPHVLQGLIEHEMTANFREGCERVLRHVANPELAQVIEPVLAALQDAAPDVQAPISARKALDALRSHVPTAEDEDRAAA